MPDLSKAEPTLEHSRSCSAGYDFEAQCTCALAERIALQTEQTMHAAWRKRAEEAEKVAALTAAERRVVDAAVAWYWAGMLATDEHRDHAASETFKAVAAFLEERKEEQDVRMDD